MASLNYNTETFVNIAADVKAQLAAGTLDRTNADEYLKEKYNISKDDYNSAANEARIAEKNYYEFKNQLEDSSGKDMESFSEAFINFQGIPAHLREKEESTLQSIIQFLPRAWAAGLRGAGEGIAELGKMVLPEEITKPISKSVDEVQDTLSKNEYTGPIYQALQETFDPATTTAEEVTGEIASLLGGTVAATRGITKVAPKIPGVIRRVAGFTVADVVVGNKEENTAKILLDHNPELEPYLERLATNENDSDAVKIVKKAIDAGILGTTGEVIFKAGAITLRPLIKGFKSLKNKVKAVKEDDILTPPIDDTGKIANTEIVKGADDTFQHKVTIEQPIKFLGKTPKAVTKDVETAQKIISPDIGKEGGILKRWLTSRQGLDNRSFQALEKKEGALRQSESYTQFMSKKFIRNLEKFYGVKYKNIPEETIAIISESLGKVPRLDEGASAKILKILEKNPKKWTKAEKTILKNRQKRLLSRARADKQKALNQLPAEIQNEVLQLRGVVDNYTKTISDLGVSKSAKLNLDSNVGLYLTTDYEVFSNPKWVSRLKDVLKGTGKDSDVEAIEIIENMRELVKKSFPKEKLTQSDIDGKIMGTLNNFKSGDEEFFNTLSLGTTVGKPEHPLGKILTKRKSIPQEMRALMKEITDPVKRFSSTASKQGKLIAEHNFVKDIEAIAKDQPYAKDLFSVGKQSYVAGGKELTESLDELAHNYIRALGPKANPLVNIYTTPSFKNKLLKGLDINTPDWKVLRAMHGLQAYASGAQTILSEATHIINLKGNVFFTAANGNLTPFSFSRPLAAGPDILKSLKRTLTSNPDLNRLIRISKDNKLSLDMERFRELKQLGMVDQSVSAEYFLRSWEQAWKTPQNVLEKTWTNPYKKLGVLYRSEDAVSKIFNFYQELAKYRPAFPNLTSSELKSFAAEVVKDTHPTYSRVPRLLKATRVIPVIGAFPSFLAESVRVGLGTLTRGYKDVWRGIATKNPHLAAIGADRIAASTAVAIGYPAYYYQQNLEKGVTPQDEKVLEQNSPSYEKNSIRSFKTAFHINPKNGHIEATYQNQSRIDPYDAMRKLEKASRDYIFSHEITSEEQLSEFFEQLSIVAKPLLTESLAIEPIINAIRHTKRGRPLTPSSAGLGERWIGKGKELVRPVVPRTGIDIYNTLLAAESEEQLHGKGSGTRKYGLPNRLEDRLMRFLGVSQTTFDFNRSLQMNVNKKSGLIKDINKELTGFLTNLQSGVTDDLIFQGLDWNDPEVVKNIIKDVDSYVVKSFKAQRNLAEHLYNAKTLNYYEDIDDQRIKRTVDNKKLISILTEKGFRKNNPNFDMAVAENAMKNGVGIFIAPKISAAERDRLLRYIPSKILNQIESRLVKYEAKTVPLLNFKKEE